MGNKLGFAVRFYADDEATKHNFFFDYFIWMDNNQTSVGLSF